MMSHVPIFDLPFDRTFSIEASFELLINNKAND